MLARPDVFFSAISRLEINLPIPLSWSDFVRSLRRVTGAEAACLGVTFALLLWGLHFATVRDDQQAYITLPPRWRVWISDAAASHWLGNLLWLFAAMALFAFESHHIFCVLLVNHAVAVYGYAEVRCARQARRAVLLHTMLPHHARPET